MPSRRWIAALLVAVAWRHAAGADSAYEIKLTRGFEVGQHLHFRGEASIETETTTITGTREQRVLSMQMVVTLDSDARILKVDGSGRPIGIAHTVRECVMMENGMKRVILPPGITMIARKRGAATTFFVKKHRFSEQELQALETVAGLDVYSRTDDKLFGSARKRHIGEEWPINAEALAEEFRTMTGGRMPPRAIRGKSMLVEVRDQDGQPCQLVRTELIIDGSVPGLNDLPDTALVEQAELKVQAYDLLPVDVTQPAVAEQATLEMSAVVVDTSTPARPRARITAKIRSQREFELAPETAFVEP